MSSILILYHSQEYGNTAKMAEAVAAGAKATGVNVTLFNANEARFDIEHYRTFDAAAFGTPDYYSYFAGTLKVFLDDWYLAKRAGPQGLTNKPVAFFLSHGGGGAARKPFLQLFSRMGIQVGELVESRGMPSEAVLEQCCALGEKLAKAVG